MYYKKRFKKFDDISELSDTIELGKAITSIVKTKHDIAKTADLERCIEEIEKKDNESRNMSAKIASSLVFGLNSFRIPFVIRLVILPDCFVVKSSSCFSFEMYRPAP